MASPVQPFLYRCKRCGRRDVVLETRWQNARVTTFGSTQSTQVRAGAPDRIYKCSQCGVINAADVIRDSAQGPRAKMNAADLASLNMPPTELERWLVQDPVTILKSPAEISAENHARLREAEQDMAEREQQRREHIRELLELRNELHGDDQDLHS